MEAMKDSAVVGCPLSVEVKLVSVGYLWRLIFSYLK